MTKLKGKVVHRTHFTVRYGTKNLSSSSISLRFPQEFGSMFLSQFRRLHRDRFFNSLFVELLLDFRSREDLAISGCTMICQLDAYGCD
jgi:hypothetical protein